MRRHLVNFLTLLSLLLCLAVAAMWVRGRGGLDAWEKYDPRFGWGVYLGGGHVTALWYFGDEQTEMMPQPYAYRHLPPGFVASDDVRDPRARFDYRVLGFQLAHRAAGLSHWTAGVPYWFLLLATAAGPVAWAARLRRRRLTDRRRRAGLCPRCGYDLRAAPGRCPECGGPGPTTNDAAT